MEAPFFKIPYYHDFISPALARAILAKGPKPPSGGLETKESLQFLTSLYEPLETRLAQVLAARIEDRKFIDTRTRAVHQFNQELGRKVTDPDYQTILGLRDSEDRIVFGPHSDHYARAGGAPIAPLPDYLKGPHVTLFGPPDSAKMAINAMNAYHRIPAWESPVIQKLLLSQNHLPMWGADDEDSKTPLHKDLLEAGVNLTACFEGTLKLTEGQKTYSLASDHLSLPIKRFPGLAIPCPFLFHNQQPIPLHLYDFALHLFKNWHQPRALVFYVPKLENEEEAAYIHQMIATAEAMIQRLHSNYVLGSVRLMIVLENPRAILRTHEIMDALYPYFAGASLGWHDYLASTARVFKEDSNYRIPVKADPNIVVKYIQASHRLLAQVVGSRGGIKVGGMYGVLPVSGNTESLQVTLRGFFKDVLTQLKRELTGFWVAHPDFMRLGLALVEGWRLHQSGNSAPLKELVTSQLSPQYQAEILSLMDHPDSEGVSLEDPGYVRSLVVSDIGHSDFIANHHPDEIRYNVRQSLLYVIDWLTGNGCVALPSLIEGIPIRIMDDLATAERSRWEVWHEIRHGRFPVEELIEIIHQEMKVIRNAPSPWHSVTIKIVLQLMTASKPPEFATELLLPFTVDWVRNSNDPWLTLSQVDVSRYEHDPYIWAYNHYFEICGVKRFAQSMAKNAIIDLSLAERIIYEFTHEEVLQAASFHGDIGQSKATLDSTAASEQAGVHQAESKTLTELLELCQTYVQRFGFKFLVSAQGKTASELLALLKTRLTQTYEQELQVARQALFEISSKRLAHSPLMRSDRLEQIRKAHGIHSVSIAVNAFGQTQALPYSTTAETLFQIASLSKPIASRFALQFFRDHNIPLSASVNSLLAQYGSSLSLHSTKDPAWANLVTLADLLRHTALNKHYVDGNAGDPLTGLDVIHEPGTRFQYSGGGFIVLEHLMRAIHEAILKAPLPELLPVMGPKAMGYDDADQKIPEGALEFPQFAAGMWASAQSMAHFLHHLSEDYKNSEETAVQMLSGSDLGSRDFMGCDMGLGIFTAECGPNRVAIHQGANDGFRALFVQCFEGPDAGKGFVILCNGSNRAVPMIAEMARALLTTLKIQGVDFERIKPAFDSTGLAQEQIVNQGYKTLVFDAFEPTLPPPIERGPEVDPLAKYNLAVGSKILSVSNQRFARAENLISEHPPVFDPTLFCEQGKVMDSWETARHNPRDFEFLTLELVNPGPIHYVSLSTQFHDGNHPEWCRILGRNSNHLPWTEILPITQLKGHSLHLLSIDQTQQKFSEIQIQMGPDGGLTRIGLFSALPEAIAATFSSKCQPIRFAPEIPKTKKPLSIAYTPTSAEIASNFKRAPLIDWAGAAFGGKVIRASNEHYGPAAQVISPYPPIHMFDGMESARSRVEGHFEEVEIRLAQPQRVQEVILDFKFFINNNPRAVSIHGLIENQWIEVAPLTPVKAFAGHFKCFKFSNTRACSSLRIRTYPDGGIHRIKVRGLPV